MRREALLQQLGQPRLWDLAIVGGGATGLGLALEAAARGHAVVLLESHDFAGGTSSRSTKLLHGGVRYLAQGRIGLVRQALRERAVVLRSAPHLAAPLPFVLPTYGRGQRLFYGAGLAVYDLLAGAQRLGRTAWLSSQQTLQALPGLQPESLRGGIRYWDGQFDDARLAIALARTAGSLGGLMLNYCEVRALQHEQGRVVGLIAQDRLSGRAFEVRARCVVNATGVWVDGLRAQDAAARAAPPRPLITPSQGVHVVVDQDFLPGRHALLVPRTADGRVLFAIPWLGKLVLGTTDTPRADTPREPAPWRFELDFILAEAARYLARAPTLADVRSVWVGLRPLVGAGAGDTASLSREHVIEISASGLVSVSGGKWTTYRAMAEEVLARAARAGLLLPVQGDVNAPVELVGSPGAAAGLAAAGLTGPAGAHLYGSEAQWLASLPGADVHLAPGLSEAMVRFAVRYEYALTVEDVLARRSRLLFLDATLAQAVAPRVATVLEQESGRDPDLAPFMALAQRYAQPGFEQAVDVRSKI
jgi:glycerol-3-phosphate dehydrogenase